MSEKVKNKVNSRAVHIRVLSRKQVGEVVEQIAVIHEVPSIKMQNIVFEVKVPNSVPVPRRKVVRQHGENVYCWNKRNNIGVDRWALNGLPVNTPSREQNHKHRKKVKCHGDHGREEEQSVPRLLNTHTLETIL